MISAGLGPPEMAMPILLMLCLWFVGPGQHTQTVDASAGHRSAQGVSVSSRRAISSETASCPNGATICTPVSPGCGVCPWLAECGARARGDAEDFPRREAKRATKLRRGAAFLVLRADRGILVRSRPPRGLLGGMTELPTTEWTADFAEHRALLGAPLFSSRERWRRVPGVVTHAFTHFPLELVVYATEVARDTPPPAGMRFVPLDRLHDEALPALMRKVVALALGEVGNRNVSPAPSRRAAWRAARRSG